MRPKAIVFDFDGVISPGGEFLKNKAWDRLSEGESEDFRKNLKRARDTFSHGKGDRNDILKSTFSECGYSDKEIGKLTGKYSERYNNLVQNMILDEGVSSDTLETLSLLIDKGFKLYINSATPEQAVLESCKNLGIVDFFSGIYGMPEKKTSNLLRSANDANCEIEELVFVGDSDGDFLAAKEIGNSFVGVSNNFNKWGKNKPFSVISRLTEVTKFLGDRF